MPLEHKDKKSGARLFIPTASERMQRDMAHQLKKELAEVQELKKELLQLMEENKKG